MGIRRKIKDIVEYAGDCRWIRKQKLSEIEKYEDAKRKSIWSQQPLTELQRRELDDLYLSDYGKKIPSTWHRYYTAINGSFDARYFPELLFVSEFEHFENYYSDYAKVLQDKNFLPLLATSLNVQMPKTVLACTKGTYQDGTYRIIERETATAILKNAGEVFAKPSIDFNSGIGCRIVNCETESDAQRMLAELGNNFTVQERIRCCENLAEIYPGSVNTFRVITYRWKDEICFCPAILRIGRNGNYLDNAHAGGIFIAVDDSGNLGDTAYTEFGEKFCVHPDTGIGFADCRIDEFPAVLETAKKMHEAIPQVGCIHWDLTVNEKGESVLIEANTYGGGIWLPQIAHGRGPFEERTGEVLRWLSLMKKTPVSDRGRIAFGNMT